MHPSETVNRYSGLSLDEMRRMIDEAEEPRGHFRDAYEEDAEYRAWREREALRRIKDAATIADVRAALSDLDEGRPL